VQGLEIGDSGFSIRTSTEPVRAKRVLISSGAWVRKVMAMLGYQFADTVAVRVNMMSVTERMPRLFSSLITHANSGLTLKQPDNGTVLIGGGWQGRGDPYSGQADLVRENVTTNFRLTHSVFPASKRQGSFVHGSASRSGFPATSR
jgi:glycine/D-amino acid oxidase-like deaminating enzyme